MQKLWQKNSYNLNSALERFETADDLVFDNYLATYDIYGSLAHAYMLNKVGILEKSDFTKIVQGLHEIQNLIKNNQFTLEFGDEDIHTKVESKLTELVGEPGKKIHTGRSRNDQVLTDIRLFTRDHILSIKETTIEIIKLLVNLGEKYSAIPMPGYTHMQKAMPSSLGLWFGSYAESLIDNLKLLDVAYELNNQSPLGSGAGYGLNLPLDRELTSSLLGFDKVQNNALYVQNSKGKIESTVVFALMQIVFDISKMSSDLLLFTTSEFNYFKIEDSITTGSSIMPQKKNLDIAELLRSKIHIMHGYFIQVYTTVMNLPSGYNRDSQDIKKPFIEALNLSRDILEVFSILIQNVTPNVEILKHAMTQELYATASVYQQVSEGVSFREAYKKVGENLESVNKIDFEKYLQSSTHSGSLGKLEFSALKANIESQEKELKETKANIDKKMKELMEGAK